MVAHRGSDMTEHEHKWELATSGVVIATYPEQYPYRCECGAFTHDPKTGAPCPTCAPQDWARRTDDLITLRGGHFDGEVIPRPISKTINLRVDPVEKRVQLFDHYRQSEDDGNVFEFDWNSWTHPLVPRAANNQSQSVSNGE